MERNPFPFYFPTSVLLIDDDPGFLKHFSLLLDAQLAYRSYSSVRNDLTFINTHDSILHKFSEILKITMLED